MNKGAYGINAPGGVRETEYIPLLTASYITLVHDLGRAPDLVTLRLLCVSPDGGLGGWIPGEVAVMSCNTNANTNDAICAACSRTTVKTHDFLLSDFYLPSRTTGVAAILIKSRWKVKLRAIWIAPV
jgi:hypothetical protein